MRPHTIRLNLFAKGLLLISLPLLFTLLLVGLLFRAQYESAEAARWQTHTREVLRLAERMYTKITEAHSATRGYIVIGPGHGFRQQSTEAVKEAEATYAELSTLVTDNSVQAAQLAKVKQRMDELWTWLLGEQQQVTEGRAEAAVAQLRTGKGVEMSSAFVNELEKFTAEEERLDAVRSAAVVRARTVQRVTLISGAFATLVVSGSALVVFGKGIAARVATVTENATRLADGRPLLARMGGSDEIATLDEVMHATSDKLAEAAKAEDRFKHELERRADELVHANESLRQQTQENEMFVYSVSHDLRSPLVNLQGFSKELEHSGRELTELLSDERIPGDVRKSATTIIETDVKDSIRFIQTAVSRSASIIDSLLRLSRAGRVVYRPEQVDVNGTVKRVIDAMRGSIDQRGATLKASVLLPVWGDATAVEQIFGNLIGNAVNYLDATRPGFIEIGMLNSGAPDDTGMRTYYVRDNGLGIPEAHINKVFVAFQRLHGDVAKGEGIGLALVRRIIERHGGRASVESTVGVGTTFFVSLPAEAPAEPKEAGEGKIGGESGDSGAEGASRMRTTNQGDAGAKTQPAGADV